MLLIAKGSFRELVGGSDDILANLSNRPTTPRRDRLRYSFQAGSGPTIDAAGLKRIVFTNFATNVTLGPVTVHLPDLAVLA
jgi:hypothetical protein